jgi:hypothetical protein
MLKKIYFFIHLFLLWTNISFAYNIIEDKNINIVINSVKSEFESPVLISNNYTLVPFREICNFFNIPDSNIIFDNKNNTVCVTNGIKKLSPSINNNIAYIDSIPFSLPVNPIIYDKTTYVPLRVIGEFLDCIIIWDSSSRSVFIKDTSEYSRVESFFNKVENNLKKIKTLKIDVINEFKDTVNSYSFGNSIYIDTVAKKVFHKNILDKNWKYETLESNISKDTPASIFNNILFAGISFNRQLSDENFMVFNGYYSTNQGVFCKTYIYINTTTLYIEKQITEFKLGDTAIRQQILYSS